MKKINTFLILIAMLSLLGLGGIVYLYGDNGTKQEDYYVSLEEYQDNYVTNLGMNKEIVVSVWEDFSQVAQWEIYDFDFQKSVRERIDAMIADNRYDEDQPLVIFNPFLTNNQSLYVYFETEQPYAVSYSVHTPDADYEDEDMSDYDMPETEEEAEASEEEEDYSDDSDEDEAE